MAYRNTKGKGTHGGEEKECGYVEAVFFCGERKGRNEKIEQGRNDKIEQRGERV